MDARIGGAAPAAPRDPLTAYAVVVRGLTSLALVWQGLWIAAEPRLWPSQQETVALSIALALPLIAWLAMLAAQLRGSARFRAITRGADVLVLVAATLVLLVATAVSDGRDWAAATHLAVLAVGLPGLLFRVRVAVVVFAGVLLAQVVIMFLLPLGAWNGGFEREILLDPLLVLSSGVVTMAARYALTRDALRADSAAAQAVRAERERRTTEGVGAMVRRQELLLHETVLNTLTAIDRGGLTSTPELRARLVDRCRESASVLRDLRGSAAERPAAASGNVDLRAALQGSLLDLDSAGVSVEVDCDSLDGVPTEVYAAFRTAVREALSNVVRHARARSVRLTVRLERLGDETHVTADVRDDGVGFDPGGAPERYGLSDAISMPISQVGGLARVDSIPGDGTTVHLEWRSDARVAAPTRYGPSAPGFAVPVLAVFGLYSLSAFILTWHDYEIPALGLLAFAIFAGAGGLLIWGSRAGQLPWWIVVVVIGVSPLVYRLQQMGNAGAGPESVDWASGAITALFLVVAGIGPPWAWLTVLVSWVLIQGDVLGELVSPGTAIILGGALFGRSTRRNSASSARFAADQLSEQTALAVARESVARLRRRYGALRESRAIELLDGIAEGSLDPDDPQVQAWAAIEERFVRTVIRVDPSVDAVHALATSLAVRARRRGVFLDVDLASTEAARSWDGSGSRPSFVHAVEASIPGEVARLSARTEGDSFVIRLLAPIARGRREDMTALPVPGVILDPADPDDPSMLWEVRQPVGGDR